MNDCGDPGQLEKSTKLRAITLVAAVRDFFYAFDSIILLQVIKSTADLHALLYHDAIRGADGISVSDDGKKKLIRRQAVAK